MDASGCGCQNPREDGHARQRRPRFSFALRHSPGQSVPIPNDALIIVPVRNTVLFPGVVAPDHRQSGEIDRRRATGACASSGRSAFCCSETPKLRIRPPTISTGSAPSPTSSATSPRRTKPITSSARACSASACSTSFRARRSRRAGSAYSGTHHDLTRDRGAISESAAAGDRSDPTAAAGAAGTGRRISVDHLARRAGRSRDLLHGHQAAGQAGNPGDDRPCRCAWRRCRAIWPSGSKCFG